ncbi:Rho GTPase protein rac1 [Mucor velutinosus]|uniref:Rho GTPase protein rac1 n=1 Tax=Mucor velutinosus TaxID=708070 RepID=A0AAN7DMT9_9FUNG|nr:Rho GTPase protein rac1 [Mucor velutinosus]
MTSHHRRSYNAQTKLATPSFEIKPTMDLCNLYIKGIQPGTTSTDLFNLFKPFGRIISAKVMPQDKGKQGFGFVSYSKSVEAAHAILSMNHTDDMVVRFHEPKVPRKEHNFDQQLAYLSDSELAMHFYTRPLHNNDKVMPLATTNKSAYTSTGVAAAAAAAAATTAIPYYYYPHPSLYYHHPPMYAQHASPQLPFTQDQYIQMKLLDMLNYIKIDMSNQERGIVQQQLTQLDLNEQYACINNVQYFQQKISNMLAVYSDSHGAK